MLVFPWSYWLHGGAARAGNIQAKADAWQPKYPKDSPWILYKPPTRLVATPKSPQLIDMNSIPAGTFVNLHSNREIVGQHANSSVPNPALSAHQWPITKMGSQLQMQTGLGLGLG